MSARLNDALMYASIKNNLTSEAELTKLANSTEVGSLLNSGDPAKDKKQLDEILADTTLKRGVCRANSQGKPSKVLVRIPIPKGASMMGTAKKYGYKDVLVDVSTHPRLQQTQKGYKPGNTKCNQFYYLYCANVRKGYKKANDGRFDVGDWPSYKADCACFPQDPVWLNRQGVGSLPGKCWAPKCGAEGAYEDEASRGKTGGGESCSVKVCNTDIDFSDVEAGEIDAQIDATCGGGTPRGSGGQQQQPSGGQQQQQQQQQPSGGQQQQQQPSGGQQQQQQPSGGQQQQPAQRSATTTGAGTSTIAIGGVSAACCCCLILFIIIFMLMR